MTLTVNSNIRWKLLIPFALSLFIVISGIQLVLYLHLENEQQAYVNNFNIELDKSFTDSLDSEAEHIFGFLNFIKENNEIQQAWLSGDKQRLLDASLPVFQHLYKNHRITHFYYHNTDAINFLRVHAPDKNGDKINRATLDKTIATQELTSGIEFGTLGQFVLRVVIPWKINNELVGYIELGEEIDHIIERLSTIHNYQLILSVSSDFIKKHQLNTTNIIQDQKKNITKENKYVIINQTFKNPPVEILNFINNSKKNFIIHRDGASNHLISSIAIRDFSTENVGKLTYYYDINKIDANHDSLNIRTLAINFSVGLILFIFYYLYSGKINRTLQTSYNRLNNEISERRGIEQELVENSKQLEKLLDDRSMQLENSKKRYRTLFNKTADAHLLIEGNRFIDCNQASLDLLGYQTKDELHKVHPSRLSPEFQPDGQPSISKANEMIAIAYDKSSHRFDWTHMRKSGEEFPAEVLLTAIELLDGEQLLHVVIRDVTEKKKAEKEINFRAYYDTLTKLPNRQLLLDRLEQTLLSGKRRQSFNAILFIDLDRFKTINDSLGHSIGDLLLIEVAKRISSCIRKEDTAARFGGDEFVVLLKHLGSEEEHAGLLAERIAKDVQQSFLQPFIINNNEFYITSSIGINIFPLENETMDDIIKHADTAMYSGKESGRNKITFYLSNMHDAVLNSLVLEKDLRQAIKDRKLEVFYQPKLDNDTNIIGIEALIRWHHPELGKIDPDRFISIAEDSGMIYEIGEFVLHRAISDILKLHNEGYVPLSISVNISPYQFRHPGFIDQIQKVTQQYHLERHFLTLEITEGVFIDNLNETVEKFEQLRSFGIRMSLDDFGTGYSSLSYLKRLPLDELKIDKSFIFDVMKDPHDAQLVTTIINIADQFGLDTVAEGVENAEQLRFLKRNNCRYYQGHYYSRPLSLEQLKNFLLNNTREQKRFRYK